MNKLAVITGFLGLTRNRYMQYQDERTLEEKFALAGKISNLDGFELCYPADFEDLPRLKMLLRASGYGVSAVNFRSRRSGKWWRGSFSSAQESDRREVVDEARKAMDCAAEVGTQRITTCPLNDGHDYVFEMNYIDAYRYAEESFARICEHNAGVKVCIEYKWNDPRARCLLGTAGEALSFCQAVGMPNLGVTMDIGHALYGRENPSQAACLLARGERLFYVHLNDNDRNWDWDMLPGAYHFWEFVEFFYYLRKLGYADDWYGYDVYPKEIDTALNFTTALEVTRKLESITDRIDPVRMEALLQQRNPAESVRYLYSLL